MSKKKCKRCGCLMPWIPESGRYECLYCGFTIDPTIMPKRYIMPDE